MPAGSYPKRSAHSPLLLAARARGMRFNATFSEERLWEAIRGRRLGVQFRRQVPLCGRFIVDFLAPELRLVVEVDGEYHGRRPRADARRDEVLGWPPRTPANPYHPRRRKPRDFRFDANASD